ncbi:hypothetical protein BH18ACT12_BH18ACT12_14420 [soil metagenome]
MDTYDWLLFLHVTGAFMVLGGAVMAGVFNVAALRRERPSEIALLFRLVRVAVTSISVGMLLTVVFGLWLVAHVDYGWGDAWIVASLLLWVVANALGGIGGGRDKRSRELAERLAVEGDAPSAELSARLRDPVSLALNWGSGVVVIVILALMIWKLGA